MGVCQNCLFGSRYSDSVIWCPINRCECEPTDTCEWFCIKGVELLDSYPEEWVRSNIEWAQKMKKMYEDTMAVPWEILLAPKPDWWFDFVKKTRKRLSGFVYRRGSKIPAGKWIIQMFEPIDGKD